MKLKRFLRIDTVRGALRAYALVLVCLPLGFSAVFFALFQRERILHSELSQLVDSLNQERTVVRAWLAERFDDIRFLADLEAVRRGDPAAMDNIFRAYVRAHQFAASLAFVNAQGYTAVDMDAPTGVYVGDQEYFKEAKAGRTTFSGERISRVSGAPMCIFATPVLNAKGEFRGVVSLPVQLASLGRLLTDQTGATVLVSGEGRMLAPEAAIKAAGGLEVARASALALTVGEGGGMYTGKNGQEMIGASLPLGIGSWRLLREQPLAAVLAGYQRQIIVIVAGAAVSVLLLTPLLLRFCRNLERPLESLSRYVRELRTKRFELSCPLEMSPAYLPLELRELHEAFCAMTDEVRGHIQEQERLSIEDPLTGLYNRRFLYSGGAKLLDVASRAEQPCSCLMVDVDHFKAVNDTFGHQAGDQVLVHVASIIAGSVRKADLAARYGGEEFAVLLTGASARQGAALGERIRNILAASPCRADGREMRVTVSIGVAMARREVEYGNEALDDLLARADQAMYAAKAAGRDRVLVEANGKGFCEKGCF